MKELVSQVAAGLQAHFLAKGAARYQADRAVLTEQFHAMVPYLY